MEAEKVREEPKLCLICGEEAVYKVQFPPAKGHYTLKADYWCEAHCPEYVRKMMGKSQYVRKL